MTVLILIFTLCSTPEYVVVGNQNELYYGSYQSLTSDKAKEAVGRILKTATKVHKDMIELQPDCIIS